MKTYFFTTENHSDRRGYNRTVKVYRVKNNQPIWIGYDDEISTASYKGDYAIACEIINQVDGHKMTKCGYHLESKNIKVLGI